MAYTKTVPPNWSYTDAQGNTHTYSYTGGGGGNCSGHTEGTDVGTASCSSHRSTCSGNKTNFTDNTGNGYTISAGWAVRASHISDLRSAVQDELVARNNHADYSYTTSISGSAPSAGNTIDNSHLQNVEDALDRMTSSTTIPSNGSSISASTISTLRDKIRNLEDDCICNSDCECNSVCTCNTDCKCNYSDITLKRDVENLNLGLDYLNSLGTYKFKYLWEEKEHYGVMAQELNNEVLVSEDKNGKLMVSYMELIPILMNAVKELSEKVNGK